MRNGFPIETHAKTLGRLLEVGRGKENELD